RRERPGKIRVPKIQSREHGGADIDGPPGFDPLFPGRLQAGPSELVTQEDGPLKPLGSRPRSLRKSDRAGLEQPPAHSYALTSAGARHRAARRDRITSPV